MSSAQIQLPWNTTKLNSTLQTSILAFVVTTLCYLSAKLAGALIINIPQTVWPLWPGCAVLVAILLLQPRKLWPVLISAGLAGFLLYDLQTGVPSSSIAWLMLADTLEVLVAAWGVSYALNGVPRLDSLRALAKYSFFTVFLASFIVSSIGIRGLNGESRLNWQFTFLSEALAFLTVTPAILGFLGQGRTWLRASRAYYMEIGVLVAAVTFLSYVMFVAPGWIDSPAILYSLVPFLIWSALRSGSAGVGTSATIIALMSIWGAVHGRGPFTESDPTNRILHLQLFLAFASMPFMVLAVLVEERKVTQDDLRKSEERLRSAMESGKAVGWEWNLQTGQDSWFGDLQFMFGIPSESFVGSPEDFHSYVYPEDRQQVLETIDVAKKNHKPFAAEFRILWPNGIMRWVTMTGQFQYSSKGQPERMLGMAVDITDRRRAEQELVKSQERFSKAFRRSPMLLTLSSAKDHRYIEVNETFERVTGWRRDEVIGRTAFEIGLWVDPIRRVEAVERLKAEGSVRNLEARFSMRDGSIRIGQISAELIELDGQPCALGVIADITEQKRAEEALRESEERFRLVANTAPMLIWMSDTDRLCTYFNDSWLAFTGRSLGMELGNGWAEGVHPEDFQQCLDTYTRAFDAREMFNMEYRLRRHDGEYRWVLDIGVPRFNQDRSFAGFIGSCVDVTDRKLAEEALSNLNRRLIEAQERERSRIARELHDDVCQRLAMLTIEIQQVGQTFSDLPSELLQRIAELAKYSFDIANDVQSLSHELHSSKLEYLGIATAMEAFCKEFADQQKVEVVFTHNEVPRTLSHEISLCLFRVLQEALQNALKHSGVRHFEVELRHAPDAIHLNVLDSGRGFSVEGAMQAHGLGLVSMSERLKLVDGLLAIESQPQCGTAIRAHVPLAKVARASA